MAISKLFIPLFSFYAISASILYDPTCSLLSTLFAASLLIYFKNKPHSDDNAEKVLEPHKVQIIAHRGGANDAPENTLESFKEAKLNGADAIEFDLEFTSDGVPILMHDDTVDRTTDFNGPIKSLSYQQVMRLNASSKDANRDKFPDCKVPTLDEAVECCLALGLKMYIDVKGNAKQAVPALLDLFRKYPALYTNAIVCSFWPQISYLIRRRDPNIVCACTYAPMDFSNSYKRKHERPGMTSSFSRATYVHLYIIDCFLSWAQKAWIWYLCGASAILLSKNQVSQEVVDYFSDRGVRVVVWTPNTVHEKCYVSQTLGCSYITDTLKSSSISAENESETKQES